MAVFQRRVREWARILTRIRAMVLLVGILLGWSDDLRWLEIRVDAS